MKGPVLILARLVFILPSYGITKSIIRLSIVWLLRNEFADCYGKSLRIRIGASNPLARRLESLEI